eukprot:CAMPEP_0198254630 /NCGR_PEP_ID=MMETSP1447-20131203/4900_1 /TAXON_ID=420782 /ORGANISM="Chaetoceros dichaeta, Strain CCMP1751" /LENGTH=164 /DNA_ID=CAMNT_0043940741 /DNA_START=193 /DNA_END=684 /DNA_ORIENTATION=-
MISMSSSPNPSAQSPPPPPPQSPPSLPSIESLNKATTTLQNYDQRQQTYMALNPIGLGGGTAALNFLRTELTPTDRQIIKDSLAILVAIADHERSVNSAKGRIMLGFCAENVPEALLGLKTWIPSLGLPRGLLHGLDVDGVAIEPETLGCVYVKYNSGGSMTFG